MNPAPTSPRQRSPWTARCASSRWSGRATACTRRTLRRSSRSCVRCARSWARLRPPRRRCVSHCRRRPLLLFLFGACLPCAVASTALMTTPLGKYKLVKLIASGGMAEVYLARQAGAAGFEKLICLKRILPHLARDKQFVDMFLNEARLAAQLDHPNIVSIFDLGEANGNYFIAMEFIDGPSLRAVHKRAAERNELLPIPEIVKIISMAAGGLQYAHDLTDAQGKPLGLVHRDISPDNILVHRNGSAKVVDFGIAKAANSSGATRTGTLKGKVAYMPPEQLRGETLDRRTDVFALGVVLYELLAGRRPWEGTSEVALIGQIMTQDPAPLAELRPEVPEEL